MFSKRKLQLFALFFILSAAGAFYMNSSHDLALTQRTMSEVAGGSENGDKAPDFALKNLAGETVELSGFSGEKVMLLFFTTWCHVCAEQWNELDLALSEGLMENINIVAVNLTKEEQSKNNVLQYAESLLSSNVTVLMDEEGAAQEKYKVFGVPTVLLIDEEGIIDSRLHSLTTREDISGKAFFQK